jgi:signal transduction histidine kinase
MRLRQLLRNLLSNARKYGGPQVRIEGRIDRSTYVCSVIDNGPGIPDEIAPRLFERFIHQGHQTATKDSVGLGLSIVHALAQGMGGSISYERVLGESYFSLRLPLAREAFPSGTAPPQTDEHETSDEPGVPEEALHTGSEPA